MVGLYLVRSRDPGGMLRDIELGLHWGGNLASSVDFVAVKDLPDLHLLAQGDGKNVVSVVSCDEVLSGEQVSPSNRRMDLQNGQPGCDLFALQAADVVVETIEVSSHLGCIFSVAY